MYCNKVVSNNSQSKFGEYQDYKFECIFVEQGQTKTKTQKNKPLLVQYLWSLRVAPFYHQPTLVPLFRSGAL